MSAKILWFTGLSGAGKTTLSKKLEFLLKKKNKKIKVLDGDVFRKKNKQKNNFTKQNILNNNYSIIKYIKTFSNRYDFILVSVISPLSKTRRYAKKIFKENYFEIFVNCKIKTLEKRDPKKLYKKARLKIIKNLIGYNSKIKYQNSNYPVIKLNTDKLTKKECINLIYKKIRRYL